MAKVVNYLDELRYYIKYDKVCELLLKLIQMITIDAESGNKSQGMQLEFPNGNKRYSVVKDGNDLIINQYDSEKYWEKNMILHFNLGPAKEASDKDVKEETSDKDGKEEDLDGAKWGSVNIRIEIDNYSAIIFSKRFKKIANYQLAEAITESDLRGIDPVYRINYDKDHFRIFDLVTNDTVGYTGSNVEFDLGEGEIVIDNQVVTCDDVGHITIKPEDDDSSNKDISSGRLSLGVKEDKERIHFLEAIGDIHYLFTSGGIIKYIFDEDELSIILSQIEESIGQYGKNNNTGRRIGKNLGIFGGKKQ